jgi:hypothetical protein
MRIDSPRTPIEPDDAGSARRPALAAAVGPAELSRDTRWIAHPRARTEIPPSASPNFRPTAVHE